MHGQVCAGARGILQEAGLAGLHVCSFSKQYLKIYGLPLILTFLHYVWKFFYGGDPDKRLETMF